MSHKNRPYGIYVIPYGLFLLYRKVWLISLKMTGIIVNVHSLLIHNRYNLFHFLGILQDTNADLEVRF